MKKLLILCSLLLLTSMLSLGQTTIPYVFYNNTAFGSATSGVIVNNTNSGATFHKATWTVVGGTFTTATLKIDSCVTSDPSSCNDGDILGATDAHLNGASSAINFVAASSRDRLTAYIAASGTPALKVIYTGYINNPSGTTAAGTAGQIQINNGAGNLAADTSTCDGSGNCTIATSLKVGPGSVGNGTPVVNKLAKDIGTTGVNLALATTADTAIPVYLVTADTSGAGTSGIYVASPGSTATATAENAAGITANHYVVRSTGTNGTLKDSGTTATTTNAPPSGCFGVSQQTVAANATFIVRVGCNANAPTGVTAGAYTAANITVDAAGRVTAAANGSGGSVSTFIFGISNSNASSATQLTANTSAFLANEVNQGVNASGTANANNFFATDALVSGTIVSATINWYQPTDQIGTSIWTIKLCDMSVNLTCTAGAIVGTIGTINPIGANCASPAAHWCSVTSGAVSWTFTAGHVYGILIAVDNGGTATKSTITAWRTILKFNPTS